MPTTMRACAMPAFRRWNFRTTGWGAGLCLALTLAACGGSNGNMDAGTGLEDPGNPITPLPAPDGNGMRSPAAGTSITGRTYRVSIKPAATGDTVVFTVFEPDTLTGGQKYPLVFHSHGFGQSRETMKNPTASPFSYTLGNYTKAGYGAISVDERGFGESTGKIRVMDPDAEGQNLLAVLDWAEANLDWLAYGDDDDAPAAALPNLKVGSLGGSYGGGYQLMLNAIDPRRRLDAMVPDYTWHDLRYSLNPGGVIKSGWINALTAASNAGTASNPANAAPFDPYVTATLQTGLTTNRIPAENLEFFGYHSEAYFCGNATAATNGGPGTAPKYQPRRPGKIHTLLTQGYRDTLFNFNEALANYQCLKAAGGDVRLLTYQAGHNTLQAVPDPGQAFQPPGSTTSFACGKLEKNTAALAFLDQYVKGVANAAAAVPGICLSLAGTDAITVASLTTGTNGTMKAVPTTNVVPGAGVDAPMAAVLDYTTPMAGDVLAGVPYAELTVAPVAANPAVPTPDTIVFVGIGQQRATGAGAGVWDLVDNQLLPLRGTGTFKVDLVGVAERLAVGDKLALLVYGASSQYPETGTRPPNNVPVTVSGKVWLPLLGNVAPAS